MSNFFIGQIGLFGFNFAPVRWALANGAIMGITQNTALFSLLGTSYGGNGTTTFGLPDLQSRVALHASSSGGNYFIGEKGGEETVTLQLSQMPIHNHPLYGNNVNADQRPDGNYVFATANHGSPPANLSGYAPGPGNTVLASQTVSNAGSSQPHSNIQPYLTLNYCIALQGYYPSRN